jgi:short-subunit dehydrogenase
MNLMFWAPVNLTMAVLPYMKQRRCGQLVNITSVGGRVSVPHLLPYSCAKFAFVGFSTGLTAEMRSQGIDVLTVIPGLMRTGSYLNAKFKGQFQNEFAWFALSGNLPGLSVAADYAARCIRNAMEQRRSVCTISIPAKLLIASDTLLPNMTRTVLAGVNRFLLPAPGASTEARSGAALNPSFGKLFQAVTILGRRAARDLNECTATNAPRYPVKYGHT